MQLHRANGNDWDSINVSDRNRWQAIASKTNGIVTPGNVISVVGGLLVVAGLWLLTQQGKAWLAVAFLLVGRIADLADGIAADRTGTKSPLGEATDATIDKIEIALAVLAIGMIGLMPAIVFIVLAVHTIYNVGLFIGAYVRKRRLHPSRSGKLATAFEWASIGVFVIHNGFNLSAGLSSVTSWLAWLLFVCFVSLAAVSSYQYTKGGLLGHEKSR